MANKRSFWVLSKQPKEISGFGKHPVPSQFKTYEEAHRYVRQLNMNKGAYHPGYYVEERIGKHAGIGSEEENGRCRGVVSIEWVIRETGLIDQKKSLVHLSTNPVSQTH